MQGKIPLVQQASQPLVIHGPLHFTLQVRLDPPVPVVWMIFDDLDHLRLQDLIPDLTLLSLGAALPPPFPP